MKKINKKDRIRPAKHRYYSILILILIVLVSAAAFSIYDKVYQLIEWNYFFINSVGIACQIISGIVCCIQSILGLSISLQHQDFLGVPLSKYYTLRKTPYFDFKNSALVSFGLLLFSVSGYLFSLVVFCVAAACISVAFCIYVLNIEVPFLLLREKTILSVVKDRMISEYTEDIKADDYQIKEFTEILESLICNKDLQWVYKQLSIKNEPTFNKSMLYRLMDVQSNMSFHLDQIESGISLVKATDVILGSVSDMTRSDFDIVEILGNNTREYVHLLTRVLFRLLDRPESKNKTEDTLAQMAACFFVPTKKQANFDLYFSVITIIIIEKIKQDDFSLANRVKKEWSLMPYSLHSDGMSSRIFAMISFIIYYLAEINSEVPQKTKDNIHSFINANGIQDDTEIQSWKQLFQEFANAFPISFESFYSDYQKNQNYYDYMIQSSRAHSVMLTDDVVMEWYLAHLMNSNIKFADIDYENTFHAKKNPDRAEFFKKLEDECYSSEDRAFNQSDRLINIVAFYSETNPEFVWFKLNETRNHSFRNYVDSLRMQEFDNRIQKASQVKNADLVNRFQPLLEASTRQCFGFDDTIDLRKEKQRCFSFLFDRTKQAINLDEAISSRFIFSLFYEIRKNVLEKKENTIQTGPSFLQEIQTLLKKKIHYASDDVLFCKEWISDEQTRTDFERIIQQAKPISQPQNLFPKPTVIIEEGFRFNCQIQFKAVDLSPEQLGKLTDGFRRADGQYVYQGAFFRRERLLNYFEKTQVLIQIVFSYKIKTTNKSIYVIDLYPEKSRKQNQN